MRERERWTDRQIVYGEGEKEKDTQTNKQTKRHRRVRDEKDVVVITDIWFSHSEQDLIYPPF